MAAGTSPISLPQSSSGRLLSHHRARSSWRRMMISNRNSPLFFGNCFMPMSSRINRVGLQVAIQDSVVTFERFVVQEVAHAVEDAAVVDGEAIANQLPADALHQVTFSHARRTDQNRIVMLCERSHRRPGRRSACGLHRRVELEVEVVERFLIAEGGRFGAAGDLSITANDQFIFQDQFQELGVIELRGLGLLQPYFERLRQST